MLTLENCCLNFFIFAWAAVVVAGGTVCTCVCKCEIIINVSEKTFRGLWDFMQNSIISACQTWFKRLKKQSHRFIWKVYEQRDSQDHEGRERISEWPSDHLIWLITNTELTCVGQNTPPTHTYTPPHNKTKTPQVYEGTVRNSKLLFCIFILYLREGQQVEWSIFLLEKLWQGWETLIAFNSLQRTPYFALEGGLNSWCHQINVGLKSQWWESLKPGSKAGMLLLEAETGNGEPSAVSETSWDLFNIPGSFCKSQPARKPLHNIHFISPFRLLLKKMPWKPYEL